MASFYNPGLPEMPAIDSVSLADLRGLLDYSLRIPTASSQSIRSPLDIGSINWKAVEASELLNAIGYVYAQDRMRNKLASQISRDEERRTERQVSRSPKEAKKARKRVQRIKRKAASGLFRQMAEVLRLKQQNLY